MCVDPVGSHVGRLQAQLRQGACRPPAPAWRARHARATARPAACSLAVAAVGGVLAHDGDGHDAAAARPQGQLAAGVKGGGRFKCDLAPCSHLGSVGRAGAITGLACAKERGWAGGMGRWLSTCPWPHAWDAVNLAAASQACARQRHACVCARMCGPGCADAMIILPPPLPHRVDIAGVALFAALAGLTPAGRDAVDVHQRDRCGRGRDRGLVVGGVGLHLRVGRAHRMLLAAAGWGRKNQGMPSRAQHAPQCRSKRAAVVAERDAQAARMRVLRLAAPRWSRSAPPQVRPLRPQEAARPSGTA